MADNPSNIVPDNLIVIEGGKQLVPAPESADAGKVLGVLNASGDIGWVVDQSVTFTQVQADWTEADSSKPSYIDHKPTIPSKTSDLQNDSGFVTSASVPTKTSDLQNDSGFITSSDIPAQVQADWNEADNQDPAFIKNKPTIPAAPVQSNWNESDTSSLAFIQNKPTIPAAPVQSNWNENDSSSLAYIQNKPTIPAAPVQSDWNEADSTSLAFIQNKPTIPAAAPTPGNMLSVTNNVLNVTTTAGITDIQYVNALPANPVATVLYLIPEA